MKTRAGAAWLLALLACGFPLAGPVAGQGAEGALDQPLVLVHPHPISAVEDLMPALLLAQRMGRPLLIIAEDVDGEQLATLVVNRLHGNVSARACKVPGFGDRRKAMLEDIVILTGGRIIQEDLGVRLEGVTAQDLGSASEVLLEAGGTTIVVDLEDGRNRGAIEEQLRKLREQLRHASPAERADLEERIRALSSGRLRLSAEVAGSLAAREPGGETKALIWEYDLGTLRRGNHPTSLTVRNNACAGAHTFALAIEGRSWLRITGSTLLEGIELGAAKSTAAVAELGRLEPGEQRAVVLVRCLTCPRPPVCALGNESRVELRVTVVAD